MNKSYARAGIILALLAAAPVVALDFHGWRTDGIYIQGSSVNQQSSNQANNIHDDLLDPASSSWGLYYMGEKTNNGGTANDTVQPTPFGDVPPTQPIKDNREEDREVDWATWPMVTGKTLAGYPALMPARPTFTPNVPQGWSPVECDLGNTANAVSAPDHLLAAISLTPTQVGDTTSQNRDQILTLYYPQMQAGLPGNNNASGSPVAAADVFTVRPLWARPYLGTGGSADQLQPGLRIRDLDPNPAHKRGTGYAPPANDVANPAVGVVTQAPIFARVPYTFTSAGQTVTEVLPVVYLVVGTGENNDMTGTNGDYAYVYCIALRRPGSNTASVDKDDTKGDWLPATTNLSVQEQLKAPNPWFFDPALASDDAKQGCIMWAYKVHARSDAVAPTAAVPVAGISFANVGDSTNSLPLLFLTTKDGQIIALNAKASDNQVASVDDDPRAGEERWVWKSPTETVGMMPPFSPQFLYGMAPAVTRVSLNNLFSGNGATKNTVDNAINKFKVSEWMLFVADTYGNFWGLDAPGHRDTAVTSHWTQKNRDDLGKPNGDERWVVRAGSAPLTDVGGVNPERFVVPPLVYQGNTPLQNASGATVNGSVDQGFDDEVIFASEKGSIYAFDAVGQLTVGGGATDGQPTYTTGLRFKLPQDDTKYDFPAPVMAGDPDAWDPATQFYPQPPASTNPPTEEPRLWPREPRNTGSVLRGKKIDIKNDPVAYNGYFCRAPLGVGYGANANPDGATPNLDVGEHAIYVPYLQEQTSKFGANYRAFYEYVGSIKPYGFIQMSQPISQLDTSAGNEPTVVIGGTTYKIPQRLLSVGTIKANGVPVNLVPTTPAGINGGTNPFYDPTFQNPGDTVYITSPTWFDEASSTWVTMPFGSQVTIQYFPPTSPSNLAPSATPIKETLTYPSCYHTEYIDSTNIAKVAYVRGRATLDEAYNRLELRRLQPGTGGTTGVAAANQDEDPAEISRALWTSTSEPTDMSTPPNPNNPAPNPGLTDAGFRPGALFSSGSAAAGGTVMVPAMFRGRILAFNDQLQPLRIIHGCFDPRMDPAVSTSPGNFGVAHPNANGGYGPTTAAAPAADQLNQYDPGEFYVYPVDSSGNFTTADPPAGYSAPFLAEEPALTRVGASVTIVDGWMYVVYRNGHFRAYANVGGGAGGTVGGNPPMFQPPNSISPTAGQVVKAPGIFGGGDATVAGIHIAFQNPVTAGTGGATPTAPTLDPTKYRDMNAAQPDSPLLLEWGQTFYVVVDFGPGNLNVDQDPRIDGTDIDQRVIQNDIQAQVRSSNGAVQQLPGVNKGARVTQYSVNGSSHWAAVIPVFGGIPSATNPLTPGTPLLWERNPNDANANHTFTNELTYDIQVTQQGLQWYWGDPAPNGTDPSTLKPMDPKKTHFWEVEPNQGAIRFPTTGGSTGSTAATGNWKFHPGGKLTTNEWAPLLSYNNPFVVRYKPDGPNSNALHGIWANGAPQPLDTIALDETYTDALSPGRKNGDYYITPYVPGAHSGAGTPVVPTVGQAYINGNAKQITFADHGKATSATGNTAISNGMGGTTPLPLPDQNILYVADRSHMGLIGRSLTVRVQTAPLTKLGVGALIGRASGPNGGALGNLGGNAAPAGSFEQNVLSFDDAPDQLYPSIPQSRISVTKAGTSVDLRQGAAPIPGRVPGRNTNGFFDTANQATLESQLAGLAVQVDIPLYTADDVYASRWRTTTAQGASPANAINPFFPNSLFGGGGVPAPMKMWDLAEEASQPNQPTINNTAPLGDPGATPNATNPGQSDRTRRVVVFNDANGNGQLDLLPNYREAYRTFEVQVAVKPDMKMQAAQGTLDLGSVWHGKKQPGTGAGALDIREFQAMQASLAANNTAGQIARFYQQYWRPFNIQNTGNVNLAYIKPELVTKQGASTGFLALASQGNDPWRALSLINPNLPSALTDPSQLFLRTSFDDQMLPNASQPYGDTTRGVWLQKARMGAGQPASVVYAEGDGLATNPTGNPLLRDPTNGGLARPTYMSLNIPTGSALGQFSGQIRFYNDRAVTFNEDFANDPAGFDYKFPPTYTGQVDGTLERAANGEPLEPITDPPFNIKVKVMENMVNGRYQVASGQQDPPDRRTMPTAAPVINANGQVLQMILAYASDRNNPNNPAGVQNQAAMYDLYGTKLSIDPSTLLFPFDELPLDRAPWTELASNNPGWSLFFNPLYPSGAPGVAALGPGAQISKPSLLQDGAGNMLLSTVVRRTQGAGNNLYDLLIKPVDPSNPVGQPFSLNPAGQLTDTRSAKSGVRIVEAATVTGTKLMAFYATNVGARRNIDMTWANPAALNLWAPELMIPTSQSLSSVNDPHVFTTDQVSRVAALGAAPGQPAFTLPDNAALPRMAWIAYSGTSTRQGRTDIYLDRARLDSLTTVAPRGTASQLTADQEFGKVAFPRQVNEVLVANANRTVYSAGGIDWLFRTWGPPAVFVNLIRPEQPNVPHQLVDTTNLLQQIRSAPSQITNEISVPLDPATISSAPAANQAALRSVRVLLDRSAGTVRFTTDARTLASLLTVALPGRMPTNAPDPVILADYTPATLRLTRGDVSANDPVIVPMISKPGQAPIMDASWYLQQIDPNKWANNQPVAAEADRMWLFWRRSGGTVSGGPSCFYKVLRPGFRVNAGAIGDISNLSTTAGRPAEVNPQTGTVFFPYSYEGQVVTITYTLPGGAVVQNEPHVITWADESGERPVPMDTAVNEGSLDAFGSLDQAVMTPFGSTTAQVEAHMDRIWLFWSSTRGSGGDVFYATIAPRLGLDVNVGQTITLGTTDLNPLSALSPGRVAQLQAQAATNARRHPFVLPPVARRGSFVQAPSGVGARAAANR